MNGIKRKFGKRAVSVLLALAMILVSCPLSVGAAEAEPRAVTEAEANTMLPEPSDDSLTELKPEESTPSVVNAEPSSEPSEEPSPDASAEPSVKPSAEPSVEPSPVASAEPSAEPSNKPSAEPKPIPDGLNRAEDGAWYYYNNGQIDTSYTGLVKEFGTWFYIENGMLNWNFTGLVKEFGTWFYVEKGTINWNYTGLVKDFGTWFYVDKGILNWQFTGLVKQFGTWFYVEKSVLNWNYTGLVKDFGTWFYVEKGTINWSYTGLVKDFGTWFYVDKGILNWQFTGLVKQFGTWFYVERSVLNWNYSGSVEYGGVWYLVTNGVAIQRVTGKTIIDVNLRSNAGTYYSIKTVVSANTTVLLLEKTNSKWYKVRLSDGAEGYLFAEYVKVTGGDVNAIKRPEIDTSTLTAAEKKAKNILDYVGWDLRAAFNWSAQQLPYYTLSYGIAGSNVHSEWYANYGFDNKRGNCYVMAATFYKMAKLLGYDAYFVEGYVLTNSGGKSPHGWCEIEINGATYVFDPDFQHEYERNGYQITYGASGTFKYADYKRVD